MSGEERVGQQRDVFGLDVAHCHVCGVATPTAELRAVESSSPLADHDHVSVICSTCRERVLSGEIDLESFLIDEDEPEGRTLDPW